MEMAVYDFQASVAMANSLLLCLFQFQVSERRNPIGLCCLFVLAIDCQEAL